MLVNSRTYGLVFALLLGFAGCDDPPPAETTADLPCRGACRGGTVCVNERCLLPDAALPEDATLDAAPAVDFMLDDAGEPILPPDAFVAECEEGDEQPCAEEGACSQAYQRCMQGRWSACAVPQERCDTIDNDCDGDIDEGFNLDAPCSAGVGACARDGAIVCDSDGQAVCNATPANPEPERCNGIDDNCDGDIDELFRALGTPCVVGAGECERNGVIVCAPDELTMCSVVEAEPNEETCDGRDNDCDGTVDESDAREGEACVSQFPGICAPGTTVCQNGGIRCEPNLPPGPDLCDTLDNDCDGEIDEEGPPLGAECDSGHEGICGPGTIICGADSNWVCDPNLQPEEEVCDAIDNDCDGHVDEFFPELGELCETGIPGECAIGITACRVGEIQCDTLVEPVPEICNNLDEDCDGTFDEGALPEDVPCNTGELGVCNAGFEVCEAGGVVCRRAVPPRQELCDRRDNDCDGFSDEAFPTLGQRCGNGTGACRNEGIIGCDADNVNAVCLAVPFAPQAERCDAVDNDCNGEIDDLETPPNDPLHCGACDRPCEYSQAFATCDDGECNMGRCIAGWFDLDEDPSNGCEWSCVPTEPADEVCDGLDNDCDGVVDGPACAGDVFRLCIERRLKGIEDTVCESFPPDIAGWQYWSPSTVAPGDDTPTLERGLRGVPPFLGGGVNRRVMHEGPSFRVSFYLDYRASAVGVGMYRADTGFNRWLADEAADDEAADDEAADDDAADDEAPDDEAADDDAADDDAAEDEAADGGEEAPFVGGEGYSFFIEPSPDGPLGTIKRSPDGFVLWQGTLPVLTDRLRHWVTWKRLHTGLWAVQIDGIDMTPEFVAGPDETTTVFDRLGLWLGASEDETSVIDGYVLQYDADGDDIYRPLDNCPYDYNPDQIDWDEDGRGRACDDRDEDGVEDGIDLCALLYNPAQIDQNEDGIGDDCDFPYGLAVGASFGGPMSVWTIDLASGIHQPAGLPAQTEVFDVHSSRDGWWAWSTRAVIWIRSPDADEDVRVQMGFTPDFIDDSLVYVSPDRRDLMKMPRDLSEPPVSIFSVGVGHELAAGVSPLEREIVVLDRDPDGTIRLVELDPDGQPLTPGVFVPEGPNGAFPKVSRHPFEPTYLVSAVGGVARGISILDGETGVLVGISETPTGNAVFTPAGRDLVSIAPTPYGNVVSLQPAVPDADPIVLLGPSPFLNDDGLEPVPVPPPVADTDADGRPDAFDSCPDRAQIQRIESHTIEHASFNASRYQLFELADGYALSIVYKSGRAIERRLLRLNRYGETLGYVDFEGAGRAYANAKADWSYFIQPIWVGDRYDLFHFHSRGAWHRETRRQPMTPDWRLDDWVSITDTDNEGDDELDAHFPLTYSVRSTTDRYFVSTPDYAGAGFRTFEIGNDGEIVDLLRVTPSQGTSCIEITPQWEHAEEIPHLLHVCGRSYSNTIRSVRSTTETVSQEAMTINIARTFEGSPIWTFDAVGGRNENMVVYLDNLYQVRARGLDHDGRPTTLEHVISGEVESAVRVGIGAAPDRYGVAFVANAPGGVNGLYFVALNPDASPASDPVRLTPHGVGIQYEQQMPEVRWDGESWIVIWADWRGGIQFARGRFDCP